MSQRSAARSVLAKGWQELTRRPPSQEPALDALRAFAVLLVICTHYALPEWPHAGGAATRLGNIPVFYYGWTGVDLFFVLSGLLIGRQVWREVQRSGTVQVGRFLLRRGFRIWPLYFVTLAYLGLQGHTAWPDWTFLSNYFRTPYPRSWSLSTEEQFYIILPLTLVVTSRLLPLRHQVWPLVAVLAIVPLIRKFEYARLVALGYTGDALVAKMQYPIHLHCEPLVIGLLLALLWTIRPGWFREHERGRIAWRPLAVMVAMCAVGLALDVYDKNLFAFLALGLIFGGAAYFALVDRSLRTRPLHAWPFYPISRLSYGMYLNHFIVLPGSTAWVIRHSAGLPTPLVFFAGLIVGTAISIGIATVTFLTVEQPFLQLRGKVLGSRARQTTPGFEPAI